MRTKRELITEAEALGNQLGISVSTDRLNHAELTALVDELQSKQNAVDVERNAPAPERENATPKTIGTTEGAGAASADGQDHDEAAGDEGGDTDAGDADDKFDEADAAVAYVVSKGRSITIRRGMLDADEPIRENDFNTEEIGRLVRLDAISRKP